MCVTLLSAVYIYTLYVCLVPLKVGGGGHIPGTGVAEGCEHHVWVRNQSWVLCKSSQYSQPQRQPQLPYNTFLFLRQGLIV